MLQYAVYISSAAIGKVPLLAVECNKIFNTRIICQEITRCLYAFISKSNVFRVCARYII